jgi:sporulation protein YlmC with PRC-barrel domain
MSVSGDPGTTVKTDEPDLGRIAVESERLIASNKIEGTPVYNRQGEHLGAVHHLLVDKITGQIAYAVISFGGLLGVGERYHPVPWKVVVYDLAKEGYMVDLDKQVLQGAPHFSEEELPDWKGDERGTHIHDYFQVPPYWHTG